MGNICGSPSKHDENFDQENKEQKKLVKVSTFKLIYLLRKC